MVRVRERGIRGRLVAEFPVVALVVGGRLVQLVALVGGRHIHHRRQFVEVRDHRLRAVPRGLQRVGDDQSVGFADVVDALHRERRMRRLNHVRAVLRLHEPAARQVADPIRREVRAGIDGDDARHPQGRVRVDAADRCPRMR